MSYLSSPRLHFAGYFQADVSTVNNDVRYYDTDKFKEQYQQPSSSGVSPNGAWNPEGTGVFRLVGCKITGGRLDRTAQTGIDRDPAIGMSLEVSDERVSGKLVDLDPQQQAVSEIWGMSLRLTDGGTAAYFVGDYAVAAFTNLWRRQQAPSAPDDQTLAAVYQSVLENVEWQETGDSALLEALQGASRDGLLSINFNVYGFGRDPSISRYTLGHVAGTIGPSASDEPRHFVLGRQLMPRMPKEQGQLTPEFKIYAFQCQVDAEEHSVTADFGNALPIEDATGTLSDVGDLALAVLKGSSVDDGATVASDEIALLGRVAYKEAGWYDRSAGVQTFDFADDPWIIENIAAHPLVLLKAADSGDFKVLIQESIDGLYVRADSYVFRLNPGDQSDLKLYATRYGRPVSATIATAPNSDGIGGPGSAQKIPGIPVPDVGKPESAINYPSRIAAGENGVATLTISAQSDGPGNPRGYIDGQLYAIGYLLHDPPQPASYNVNRWNFISVLIFDAYSVPDEPTWHEHIQPILRQYGNLYPIMSRHLLDLGAYNAVAAHADILKLAFSLPRHDPNYMPVTRDLSAGKQEAILKWFDNPGADGLPLKGDPADAPAASEVVYADTNIPDLELHPLQEAGKTAFIAQLEARKKSKREGSNHD